MYRSISLFSSAGIGDLGIRANGVDIIISNELVKERHEVFHRNFSNTFCISGDIRIEKGRIIDTAKDILKGKELFLIHATPPCQGMSTNGYGKLVSEVKLGNRHPIDERNRLIIPTMEIITKLKPLWVIIENVPGMRKTEIEDENGRKVNIISYIEKKLGNEYVGRAEVLACEDFGIPQVRKRLIAIYTRHKSGIKYYNQNFQTFFPPHEKVKPVSIREAIGNFPALDSKKGLESRTDFHPLHFVPIMKDDKYWWVANTKEGDTAYNNQCINPECGFDKNPGHEDVLIDGVWQSSKSIPFHCAKCGSLLPRPTLVDRKTGERRLIKGFHSAYRRMKWDKPANTITQNFLFEASDNKIHPEQNRVLSIYEAMVLQTIADYEFSFSNKNNSISKGIIAEIIGESVPPRLIDYIVKKIITLSK